MNNIIDKIVVERMHDGIHVSTYHGNIPIFEEIRHHNTVVKLNDAEDDCVYEEKYTGITIHV